MPRGARGDPSRRRASSQQHLYVEVVLPAPFGPRKPKTSPLGTHKVRSLTATFAPNSLRSARTSRAGSAKSYRTDCAISKTSTPSPGPSMAKTLPAADQRSADLRRLPAALAVRARLGPVDRSDDQPLRTIHVDLAEGAALGRDGHQQGAAPVDGTSEDARLLCAHPGHSQSEGAELRDVDTLRQLHLRAGRLEIHEFVFTPVIAHRDDRRRRHLDRRAVPRGRGSPRRRRPTFG